MYTTKKALWLSPHMPTDQQRTEARERWEADIVVNERLTALANFQIENDEQLEMVMKTIMAIAEEHNAVVALGVFAVSIQEQLVFNGCDGGIPCYEVWSTTKHMPNGQPLVEHIKFCYVGSLNPE